MNEVTGIAATGSVCDIHLYHGGSWRDYPGLKSYVQQTMYACSDQWVTQAFIQVTGRVPNHAECNPKLYGEGRWNGYNDLLGKVRTVRSIAARGSPDAVHFTGTPPTASTIQRRYHILTHGGDLAGPLPGGEVLDRPFIYALYWGPAWKGRTDLVNYFNGALRVMGRSNWESSLSQYGVGPNTDVGYWVDTDPYDSAVGTSAAVVGGRDLGLEGAEIGKIHSTGASGIPRVWLRPSANNGCIHGAASNPVAPLIVIFIVTPRNDTSGWDGFHFFTGERRLACGSLPGAYGPNYIYPDSHGHLAYAVIKVPEAAFTSSDPGASAVDDYDRSTVRGALNYATVSASHEFSEAATNPVPWLTYVDVEPSTAFGFEGETADKCPVWENPAILEGSYAFTGLGPLSGQVVSDSYHFSSYWSNGSHGCITG